MNCKHFLLVCATLLFCLATTAAQNNANFPKTRFTCQGRVAGYYADVETGCQVYHMCDGLGRKFSYTCPNTTLFQQRMLICDHWYMVNCSKSERDYDANLLIGQRDKPFVSEADMQLRTPRPDILSVPPNNNYYDGLREAESKFADHHGNSIVGIPDTISNTNNNGLDSAKSNYRPPTSWSTGTSVNHQPSKPSDDFPNTGFDHNVDQDNLAGAASQTPGPLFQPTPEDKQFTQNTRRPVPSPPPQDLVPPFSPVPTTTEGSEDYIDIRMKDSEETQQDPVVNFIKRFDPNSPDSIKTSMSQTEILNINRHLPAGQSSAEDERTPRKNNIRNNFNTLQDRSKGVTEATRFDTVNIKSAPTEATIAGANTNQIHVPDNFLLPPKTDFGVQPSTTIGPPVYYEWKWAVPAFDLTPPKESNITNNISNSNQARSVSGKSPFRDVPRPTPADIEPTPRNTEYNISSYFVPDYVFPLDKDHPGYEDEDAQTSFQVKVAKSGRTSYGENPACPQCHPAYLKPGSCEPCIVKR